MNIDTSIQILLDKSRATNFPGIFENINPNLDPSKNTLFILTGPTGSGKTTFLDILLKTLPRVQTATTRLKREEEPEDFFLWMHDEKSETEDEETFHKHLVEKYNLLETNVHAGQLYGTPKSNIDKILEKSDAVISLENNGATNLKQVLQSEYNLVVYFFLPDNLDQLRERISKSRNDIERRIEIAHKEIKNSTSITNYYIHNTEMNLYSRDENPLEFMLKNFESFINSMRKRN